jgi:hypothetical protein
MDDEIIKTCSSAVKKGLRFLDSKIAKEINYDCRYGSVFYVLNKVNSQKLSEFIIASEKEGFWKDYIDWLSEQPNEAWFLIKLGIKDNEYIKELYEHLKQFQTVEGRFPTTEHSDTLRVLSLIEPEADATKNAANYLINNWESFEDARYDVSTLSFGILALSELNFYEYEDIIKKLSDKLKSIQSKEGFFGKSTHNESSLYFIDVTSTSIIALSRVFGANDESVTKAVEWLKKIQSENGSWGKNDLDKTAYALLALFSVGEGPKQSLDILEWDETLQLQRIKYMKPYFLQTSPIYESKPHIRDIHDKIKAMIHSAKKEIRISSLYIDALYEELIEFCRNNPNVQVNIICRPAKDIKGLRERIAKNVIDLLNIATKGNIRRNELLHARLIIIDDNQMLVSSVDLTRDQLFDEFNAGIYTRDKDSIKEAISFFENTWLNSEEIN